MNHFYLFLKVFTSYKYFELRTLVSSTMNCTLWGVALQKLDLVTAHIVTTLQIIWNLGHCLVCKAHLQFLVFLHKVNSQETRTKNSVSRDDARIKKSTYLLSLLQNWKLYCFLYLSVCRPNSKQRQGLSLYPYRWQHINKILVYTILLTIFTVTLYNFHCKNICVSAGLLCATWYAQFFSKQKLILSHMKWADYS